MKKYLKVISVDRNRKIITFSEYYSPKSPKDIKESFQEDVCNFELGQQYEYDFKNNKFYLRIDYNEEN